MTDSLDAILDALFDARDNLAALADMYPSTDPRVLLARHNMEALKEKLQVVEHRQTPSLERMARIREAFPMRRPLLVMYEHVCMRCGFVMATLASVNVREMTCPICKMPTEWADWPTYVKSKETTDARADSDQGKPGRSS